MDDGDRIGIDTIASCDHTKKRFYRANSTEKIEADN